MADTRYCTDWHDETLHLLQHRPRSLTYKMISEATGLHVGWLLTFSAKSQPEPGVNKVNTLNRFLKTYAAETLGNVQTNT